LNAICWISNGKCIGNGISEWNGMGNGWGKLSICDATEKKKVKPSQAKWKECLPENEE
jgi:hypothetical protein